MSRNEIGNKAQAKEVSRPVCPQKDCPSHASGSHDVIVHSHPRPDTIRYCCKACGRTFSITLGLDGARLNIPEAARNYASWLSKRGYASQEIAFIVGVSKRTVYRWLKKDSTSLISDDGNGDG